MNEAESLLATLSRGEKKMLAQRLKSTGKQQLLTVYTLQQRGLNQQEIASNLSLSLKATALLFFQLKEFTLTQLTISSSKEAIEIEVRNQLSQIEILKSRFLLDQALKKINRLKTVLLNHERFNYLQEVLLIEVEILQFLLSEKDFKHALTTLTEEYEAYRSKNDYFYQNKMTFFETIAGVHRETVQASFETFSTEINQENRSGEYYRLRNQLIIQLINNHPESSLTSEALISIIEQNDHEFKRLPFQRLEIYFMTSLSFILNRKTQRFSHCKRIMDNLQEEHPNLRDKYNERMCYLLWVEASIQSNSAVDSDQLVLYYKGLRKSISHEFDLRTIEQIANYYLVANQFKEARKWNNEIINKPKKKQRVQFSLRSKIRAIYLAKIEADYEFMYTLIDRVFSSKNVQQEYSREVIEELRTLKIDPNSSANLLLQYIHFWQFSNTPGSR